MFDDSVPTHAAPDRDSVDASRSSASLPPPIRSPLPCDSVQQRSPDGSADVDLSAPRTRDPQAWASAFDAIAPATYRFLVHLVGDRSQAEDLHQEMWTAALDGIDRFDPDRGDFRGWLFGIARRLVAARRREQAREPLPGLTDSSQPSPVAAPAGQNTADEQRLAEVRAALEVLPDDARAAIVAKYLDRVPVARIAEQLGRTPKAVESLLSRSRKRLREWLQAGDT